MSKAQAGDQKRYAVGYKSRAVALALAIGLTPAWAGIAKSSPELAAIDAGSFPELVVRQSYTQPVFVEFHAQWCGPCKAMEPVLREAARRHAGSIRVVTVDLDREEGLAKQLAVQGVPAILVFEHGIATGRLNGAVEPAALENFFQSYVTEENSR